jgi:ribosomal protein L22
VSRGPGNDSPEFIPAMLQSAQVIHYDRLLADAAYDGEHNHQLCREVLGIRQTIIPLNPWRSKKTPKGRYRRQMNTRFFRKLFGQRRQIESAFS